MGKSNFLPVIALVVVPLMLSVSPAVDAEEPVRVPDSPSAERIAELVRQLGSEDFMTREQATEQLRAAGAAGRESLEIESESPDPEVRQRAERILQSMDGLGAQEVFLAAMKGPWMEALKEGRLVGPLLGAAGALREPRAVPEAPAAESETRFSGYVDRGLEMLARTQGPGGRWRTKALGAQAHADVEQTALALLSFLGSGHTEKVGMYKSVVRGAVGWLRGRQQPDGTVLNEHWTKADHVAQALATMALAEAAGMANVQDTKVAAQRAIDFAIKQQDARSGGFARSEGLAPDLFTTAIHVMAMKSAKVAGMNVPAAAFEGAIRFLDSVEDKATKTYRYVPDGKPSVRATVMGLVCRQFLGWKKEDLAGPVAAVLKELGEPCTQRDASDALTNWLGTLAAFQQGGPIWKNWNDALRKNLAAEQAREGMNDGGWPPKGAWAGGGHVLSTALNVLALEVYYRYLPMYK